MTATELLTTLRAHSFDVTAEDGRVLVGPASRLTDDLRRAIRTHKPALLALLAQAHAPPEPSLLGAAGRATPGPPRGICKDCGAPAADGLLFHCVTCADERYWANPDRQPTVAEILARRDELAKLVVEHELILEDLPTEDPRFAPGPEPWREWEREYRQIVTWWPEGDPQGASVSATEIRRQTGISRNTIHLMERGLSTPHLRTLQGYARVLGLSLVELIEQLEAAV